VASSRLVTDSRTLNGASGLDGGQLTSLTRSFPYDPPGELFR